MAAVIAGLIILIILVLVAVKMGFSKEDTVEDPRLKRMIHVSGVYSILRESPRGALAALRPDEGRIRQYLAGVNSDVNGTQLGIDEWEKLIGHWKKRMEAGLAEIENGDRHGASFYYYDPRECPVCLRFIPKGSFVKREEIYNHPQIIPPFHIGCVCTLSVHGGSENLRETIVAGMRPFFENETPPQLPEWTDVVSLSA